MRLVGASGVEAEEHELLEGEHDQPKAEDKEPYEDRSGCFSLPSHRNLNKTVGNFQRTCHTAGK